MRKTLNANLRAFAGRLRASAEGPEKNQAWARLDSSRTRNPGCSRPLEPDMIAGIDRGFPAAEEVADARISRSHRL